MPPSSCAFFSRDNATNKDTLPVNRYEDFTGDGRIALRDRCGVRNLNHRGRGQPGNRSVADRHTGRGALVRCSGQIKWVAMGEMPPEVYSCTNAFRTRSSPRPARLKEPSPFPAAYSRWPGQPTASRLVSPCRAGAASATGG